MVHRKLQHILPTDKEIKLAQQSSRALSVILPKGSQVDIVLKGIAENQKSVAIPTLALQLLIEILAELGEGNYVTVAPTRPELTTQQAADILNVSRPYLIRLLEEKKIPFRKVGNRRKVLYQDVLAYKHKIDKARRKVLHKLTEEAQDLGMGYELP